MQCKDIPTKPILSLLASIGGVGCNRFFDLDNNPRCISHAMPEGTPEKLAVAKMRNLIKKGYVNGCCCGCRGDFEITDKGLGYLTEGENYES